MLWAEVTGRASAMQCDHPCLELVHMRKSLLSATAMGDRLTILWLVILSNEGKAGFPHPIVGEPHEMLHSHTHLRSRVRTAHSKCAPRAPPSKTRRTHPTTARPSCCSCPSSHPFVRSNDPITTDAMDGEGTERILSIPTESGDVPIDLADLPVDAEGVSDIVGLLAADHQPATYWATLAYEYLKTNNEDIALEFLARGAHVLRGVPQKSYQSSLLDAMQAALFSNRGRSSPKQILNDAKYQPLHTRSELYTKQVHFTHATQFTNSSSAADPRSAHAQLSRAIDMALKGATADAERIFSDFSQRQPRNTLALLGKACCLLRRRAFSQALAIYQQALALVLPFEAQNDFSRPDPRIGIGLCLAGMGRILDARRAWKRSSQLYPNNAASHLLLGLSALNAASQTASLPLGLFGVGQTTSEAEARSLAAEEGLASIQTAWKLNNKSAMTAVALANHFTKTALQAARNSTSAKAEAQFAQALKLGEHAIQYADARSDLISATAQMARTAHSAMYSAHLGLCSLDESGLRTLAYRHWTRVVEDLSRAPLPGTSPGNLTTVQALASLSLAQLQVGQSEVVAAMNTLDSLRLAELSKLPAHLLEPALLEASLRAASHPGASKDDAARDKAKARTLLQRALNLADAAGELAEDYEPAGGRKALVHSKAALVADSVGSVTLAQLFEAGQDVLANVELAQILQTEASPSDLPRAARRYTAALQILSRQRDAASEADAKPVADTSLEIRLRANLGAVLGVRALESANTAGYGTALHDEPGQSQGFTHPLVDKALEHLRVALDLIRAGVAGEDVEFEKTTVMYNAARLQEAAGHASALDDARQAYETILQIHPEYIDARVRLAIMIASLSPASNVQGKATQLANSYFKEALSCDPANLDTRAAYVCFLAGEMGSSPYPAQWAMIKDTLAELFLGGNDAKAAKTFGGATIARQVADAATHDPFIMASMGWTYYNLGREARDKKERDRCMLRSGEFFSQALANDRRCAVAAQGVGILLCDDGLSSTGSKTGADAEADREARRKAIDEALGIFVKLREVRDDGSIHVCLGHALMKREEWERASKSYEVASKQCYDNRNPHVLTYLSFADYHLGLQLKSYAHLLKSIDRLLAARELFQAQKDEVSAGQVTVSNGSEQNGKSANPRVLSLDVEIKYNRYNEAVIKQKALQMLLEVRKEERSVEELKGAAAGVEEGLVIFQELLPSAQAGQLNFISGDIIEQRIQYGESLSQRQAPQHIQEQETFEGEVAAKSEAVKALRLEKERAKAEQARVAAEEEEKRAAEIAEVRRKAMEEAREFQYRLPSPEPVKKKKGEKGAGGGGGGSKKRGRKQRGASSEVETDEEERRLNEAVLSDDEEALFTGDEDDDGEDEVARAARKEARRAEKKRTKMEELKAARAAKKKKTSSTSSKKKSSRKKSKKIADSDEEDANGAVDDSDADDDDEAAASSAPPKRKKQKKTRAPIVDEDVIDSEEEF